MSRINLQTPSLDEGIRNINFFEGRLLSSRDLQEEQAANRRHHQQLAQAIGSGVVHGLTVGVVAAGANSSTPVIKVSEGLAINAKGQALALPLTVEVNLLRPDEPERREAGLFAVCTPPQADVIYTGAGAYVLLMAPASGLRERAPKQGLNDEGKASDCDFRYAVEGVQFRLLKLPVGDLLDGLTGLGASDFVEPPPSDTAAWFRLRSALAHLCLGTAERIQYQVTFSAMPPAEVVYGALKRLPESSIGDCDVPLALLYWSDAGLRFIDLWSVRRRPIEPMLAPAWSAMINPRFPALAESAVLQFQDQIAAMHNDPAVRATNPQVEDYFTHLPPVGYLPVGSGGFDWQQFLGVHAPAAATPLSEALVRTVLDAALLRAPLRVVSRNTGQAQTATRLHVYSIAGRDNYALFARSGLAEVLAEDVFFDNSACQMPDVHTVQDALDALCRRIQGCCTVVVAPETGWEQVFARFQPGQDADICFQAGLFPIAQTLVVRNLGHVRICGAGRGTRLLAPASEVALRFESCASVTVSHLHAEAGIAQAPGTAAVRHLGGALTFIGCPSVEVDGVGLRCAADSRRAASSLYVRNTATGGLRDSTTVRVRDCEIGVGRRQTGILVMDTARCQIENNVVRLVPTTTDGTNTIGQGIVVGGAFARDVRILDNSVHDAVQGIHVGVSHREPSRGTPDSVQLIRISGNTVHVLLGPENIRERHAIFAGNSGSLIVENNYATLTRASGANQSIDGLRMYGHFGRRILVRGNHFNRFTIGILLNVLEVPPTTPTLQWVIDDNLAVSAAQVVSVIPAVLRSRVRGVSNNYA